MLEDFGAKAFAQGGIADPFENETDFSFDSSFMAQTLMRDTLVFYSLMPSLDMGVDVIFLPSFTEWQDTGIAESRWPMNARIFADYTTKHSDSILLKTRFFFGAEYIAEFKNDFYYGIEQFFGIKINPALVWSGEAAIADIGFDLNDLESFLVRVQNGISYRSDIGTFSLCYLLTADYQNTAVRLLHVIKIGSRFPFSKKFSIFAGGNFSIFDLGWSISTGSTFNDIAIFRGKSSVTVALSYRPVAGFSFSLSLDWKKIRLKALGVSEPGEIMR